MKRYGIAIVVVGLFAQMVLGAAPLSFLAATPIKALNRSIDRPITLYQSTDAPNFPPANNVFTTQTIARLGLGGIAASELSAVRNEICASSKIQAAASAVPLSFAATPGPIGFYLNNDQILAAYDDGLMGERLDSVLRKLKSSDDATKIAQAGAYALEIVRVLNVIHAADVTWNSANLHDLVVRPDGTLTALNFSGAKNSLGGADTQDKKNERMNVLANVIRPLYEILFPAVGQANPGDAYANFTGLVGIGPNWINLDLTQGNFNAVAVGAAAPTYLPGVEGAEPARAGVLRAAHRPAAGIAPTDAANMGDNTGFVLQETLMPFLVPGPGLPGWTNLTTLCATWTGNE